MKSIVKVLLTVIALSIVLMVVPFATTSAEVHYAHEFENGVCQCGELEQPTTKDLVYQIENAGQYLWLVNLINSDESYSDVTLELTADLDFSGLNIIPINVFRGTIDGKGHKIKNINATFDKSFGLIKKADDTVTVKNLVLDSSNLFEGTGGAIAGIIAQTEDYAEVNMSKVGIESTFNFGYVSSSSLLGHGAFIGYTYNSLTATFNDCYFSGKIQTSNPSSPGTKIFVGRVYNNGRLNFTNCYINPTENLNSDIDVWSSSYTKNYTNCYAPSGYFTDVEGMTSVNVGGFSDGSVAFSLGENFGQEIGVDQNPVLGGKRVYAGEQACGGEYSNTLHQMDTWFATDDNTQHFRKCSNCDYTDSLGNHQGGNPCLSDEGGICSICSLSYGEGVVHSFESGILQENGEGHVTVCDYGCGTILEDSFTPHELTYTDNEDDTHFITCDCGYTLTTEHDFASIVCPCGICEESKKLTADDCANLGLDESFVDFYYIDTDSKYQWFVNSYTNDYASFGDANIYIGADIKTDKTLANSTGRYFKGIFDGGGHTITFTHTAEESYASLIGYVNGATIRNMVVKGEIVTTYSNTATLISMAKGTVNVDRVIIESSIQGTSSTSYIGGLVSSVDSDAVINVSNTGVNLTLTSTSTSLGSGACGIIASSSGRISFTNVYINYQAPNSSNGNAITRNNNAVYKNVYYYKNVGNVSTNSEVHSVDLTAFADGSLAYLLGEPFGQNIDNGKEASAYPLISDEKVYAGYSSCGEKDISNTTHVTDGVWLWENDHHYQACVNCDEKAFYALCSGTVSSCTDLGVCSVCQHTYGILQHDYQTAFDGENHWEECSYCNDKINVTSHVFDKLTQGEENHQKICACGYTVEESHAYVNGICPCGGVHAPTLITVENYESLGVASTYVGYYAIQNGGNFVWAMNYAKEDGPNLYKLILLNDLSYQEGYVFPKIDGYVNLVIEGQGHSISGIYLNHGYLFYGTRELTIRNLSFTNFTSKSTAYSAGLILYARGVVTLENMVMQGTINCSSGGSSTAALISSLTSYLYTNNVVVDVIGPSLAYSLVAAGGTPSGGEIKNTLSLVRASNNYIPDALISPSASSVLKLSNVVSYQTGTESEIALGKYAYLIARNNPTVTIGQKIGEDTSPTISNFKVYCDGTQYTNTESTCEADLCEFCGCESAHVHSYTLSFDKDYHFNLCSCSHVDETSKEAHAFSNGVCACGYVYQGQYVTLDNYSSLGLSEEYLGYVAVSSAVDFDWINSKIAMGLYEFNLVLLNDIIFNENLLDGSGNKNSGTFKTHTPLGARSLYSTILFNGIIDGNGHKISGLYTTSSSGGLVGYTENLTLRNITLDDFYFDGTATGFIARSATHVVLDKVVIEGTLNGSSSIDSIMVGQIPNDGTVTIKDSLIHVKTSGRSYLFKYGSIGQISIDSSVIYISNSFTSGETPTLVTNSYVLGTVKNQPYKYTAEEFNSGKVAFAMQTATPDCGWGQTIGTDLYPIPGGPKVYCNGENFTNVESNCTHLGYCENCGLSNPPVLTLDKYDLDGDGNFDEVYEIGSYAHLQWFRSQINNFGRVDINVVLTADISLNPDLIDGDYKLLSNGYTQWEPIATNSGIAYSGIFDGRGHSISGLYKNNENDSASFGFFIYLDGATIKNLTLDDAYIKIGYYGAGFATTVKNSTLENCGFDGYFYSNRGNISGIALTAENSLIKNCSVKGIYYGGTYSGPGGSLVGTVTSSTIDSCLVACKNNYTSYSASIAGSVTDSVITNSINFSNDLDFVGKTSGNNTFFNNAYKASQSTDYNGYTEAEFASGLVAFEISKYLATSVWGQTVGSDAHPVIGGPKVYCNGTQFTNVESSCTFTDGRCANCGSYAPASVNEGDYDLDGDGNLDKVYLIASETDLMWFASFVNYGNYNAKAVLTENLDMSAYSFMPIGAYSQAQGQFSAYFSGIFEGNYHAITNLTVNLSTDYPSGLFGKVVGATIKNLGVEKASITNTTTAPTGILSGTLIDSVVEVVYLDGVISASNAYGLSYTATGSQITKVITSYAGLTTDAQSVNMGYYLNNKAIEGVDGEFVTVVELRSGKYAFILNGNSSTDVVWKQTLATDLIPTFGGEVVYLSENCLGELLAYSNVENEIVHIYDGICDSVCNNPDCMHERVVSQQHIYDITDLNDTHHWTQCSECGQKKDITQHTFDNPCDVDCNGNCGYEREVEDHQFIFGFDQTHHYYCCEKCNLPQDENQKYPHIFSDICDKDCNEELCNFVREVPDHDYVYFNDETQHAYACLNCGDLQSLENHVFVNGICACQYNQAPNMVGEVYQIANAGNLIWFANFVNSGNPTAQAKLVSNVNLTGIDWTPIGKTGGYSYQGTFDGNGYEITNLVYSLDEEETYGGLFGYLSNAVIKHLGVRKVEISNLTTSSKYFALIAGRAIDSDIVSVYAYGTIIDNGASTGVGGILGYSNNSLVENCITDYTTLVGGGNTILHHSFLTTDFTAEQLSGGYAVMKLNEKGNLNVWRQTLGSDTYPILRGSIVYPVYNNCGHVIDGYSNLEDTDIPSCDYDDGICTEVMGETHYKPATLNAGNYYEIKTLSDLLWFNYFVNYGHFGANAILMTDIDLEGIQWTPLARTRVYNLRDGENRGYSGIFDGNNHVIKNLTVKGENGSRESNGFFGTVSGTVKNLGIEGFLFTENGLIKTHVGAIAGQVLTGGKVERCYAVEVEIYLSSSEAGGLVGALYGGEIINSYTHNLSLEGSAKGGLTGVAQNENNNFKGSITNSYSDMTLNGWRDPVFVNSSRVVAEDFATGKFTYMANGDQSVIIWYQTLPIDQYPKLAGKQVYQAYVYCGDAMWYGNDENADYHQPQAHVFGADGVCRQVEGEYHYQEATLNEGYYEIRNEGNYLWLVNFVNANPQEVNIKLLADIDLTPYGNVKMTTFTGVLEGNNHSITIDFNEGRNKNIALFGTMKNASVQDLILKGKVKTEWYHVGALAGSVGEKVSILNTIVDVDMTNIYGGLNDWTGGIIGSVQESAVLVIDNVMYIGTISGKNYYGGFIGMIQTSRGYPAISITNSVAILENVNATGTGISTIIPNDGNVALSNIYYLNQMGSVQDNAIKIEAGDLVSGKLAYMLNGNSSEGVWRQNIGVDPYPNFTGLKVYARGENCGEVSYTNLASAINHVFNEKGVCPCGTYQPAPLNAEGVYEISTVGNLLWFADFVNGGNLTVNAKLVEDIDLEGFEWSAIARYSNTLYQGTFDGNFKVIKNVNAVIKALDNTQSQLSHGIIGNLSGTVKNLGVENFTFIHDVYNENYLGAVVGRIYTGGLVTDCYVTNSTLNVTRPNNVGKSQYSGGVVGYARENNSVVNCIAFNNSVQGSGEKGGIISNYQSTAQYTLNCYSDMGVSSGNLVNAVTTAEQFASGEITYLLNGSLTDASNIWGQKLGINGDAYPTFLANSQPVYYRQIGGCSDGNRIYGYANTQEIVISHTDSDSNFLCDYCGESINSIRMNTGDLVQFFNSVADALKVATEESVITIFGNLTESFVIPQGVTVVVANNVTLTFDELVNEGTLKLIGNLSGTTLSGSGKFYLSVTDQTITTDNIKVKESYTYGGKDISEEIKADAYLGYQIMGVEFTVDNWLESFNASVVNVGEYTITFTRDGNNALFVSATFTVTKADLTITANAHTINFNSQPENGGVTLEGLRGDDTISDLLGELVYGYGDYTVGSKVGEYQISISGLTSDNYNVTFQSGVLTVVCGNPHYYEDSQCVGCDHICEHGKYTNAVCDDCGYQHIDHDYQEGYCKVCGFEHDNHDYQEGICQCGLLETPTLVTAENYASFGLTQDYVDYYAIQNGYNLLWFAKLSYSDYSAKAVLINDIDLNGIDWLPIGNGNFVGVIDGRNHQINNLTIEGTTSGRYGLVDKLYNGGIVKNFSIKGSITVNVTEESSDSVMVGVVGAVSWGGRIENVHSSMNITVNSASKAYVGGILGYNSHNVETSKAYIQHSSFSGKITVSGKGIVAVGGIFGYTHYVPKNDLTKSMPYLTITNSIFKGEIVSTCTDAIYAGGLVGYHRDSYLVLQNNLAIGSISTLNNTHVGAIAGHIGAHQAVEESIKNNYAKGSVLYGSSNNFDDEIVDGYFNAVASETGALVDDTVLSSGKVAYLLGDAFGQNIGVDQVPVYRTESNQVFGGYKTCGDKDMYYGNSLDGLQIEIPPHQWDQGLVTIPSTCTSRGTVLYTCTQCGATKEESLPKTDHSYSDAWTSDKDNHWHQCVCGEKKDIASHNWDEGVVTIPATEERSGVKTYTCQTCNYKYEEEIAQLSHTHTFETKWTAGEETHWYASTCGHNVKSQEELHDWDEGVITKPATCTAEGIKVLKCTVCQHTKEEVLAKTSHTFSDEWSFDGANHWKEATCGCKEVSEMGAHSITDWEKVSDLSCTTPEAYKGVCEVCEYEAQRIEQSATGHTFKEEWTTSDTHHWHDASCGHELTKDMGVHIWDEGRVEIPADCEEVGVKVYTCATCSETKEEEIPATGHTFGDEWNFDSEYHWHDATCGHEVTSEKIAHLWDNGTIVNQTETHITKEYKCNCGATVQETIEATHKHTFEDKWTTSDTHHWHASTCEHTMEKGNYSEHAMIWTETAPATCTTPQTFSGVCETCGYQGSKVGNPATGHTYSTVFSKDADYHWYSATCPCGEAPLTKIPHSYTFTQQSKPSCDTPEILLGLCECGQRITKEGAPATGHSYETQWSTNATHHWHQASCGHDVFPKDYAEHRWDEGVVTKETSCKEPGEKTYTCQDCSQTKKEEIAKEDHVYSSDFAHDINHHWYPCTLCGDKGNKQAHNWDEGTIKEEANCTESGIIEYLCGDCGRTKPEVIPAKGHDHSADWLKDQTNHWRQCHCGDKADFAPHSYGDWTVVKDATENAEGLKEATCVCGEKIIQPIPKLEVEEKGLSGGAIAGIAIASTFVAGLGGFSIFWFVIKKKRLADLIEGLTNLIKKK